MKPKVFGELKGMVEEDKILEALEEAITKVIDKVKFGVINVSTVRLLHDFHFHVVPVKGVGSGFIAYEGGIALTNYHVIEDAHEVRVTTSEGKSLKGRVVGITTAMIPFGQGIGFAIPINAIKKVVEDILYYGMVRRPWLGVVGADLTSALASHYGFSTDRGALVVNVISRSPADEAGIQPGDIIVKVYGKNVKGMGELRQELRNVEVGKPVELTLVRDNHTFAARLRLEYKTEW